MNKTIDAAGKSEEMEKIDAACPTAKQAKPADYDAEWDELLQAQQKRSLRFALESAGQTRQPADAAGQETAAEKPAEEKKDLSSGERLRNLLKRRKMTQKEFAEKIGVTQGAVSRYLLWGNDKRGREPGGQVLKRMAEILDVSTDQFFGTYSESLSDFKQNSVSEIIDAINRNKDFFSEDDKMEIIKSLL